MYLGIDFGTCFSQVSTMYLDQPALLLPPGKYGIPSAFYYTDDTGIQIGEDALEYGQGFDAVNLKTEVKMDLTSSFTADGRTFTSQDIIREIYRTLIETAKQNAQMRMIPDEVEGAVISVPAKFTMQERALIRKAAETCLGAGTHVNVTGVIKEPVAAALSYYHKSLANGTCVLVYDLGGGTCDVAVVRADDTLKEQFDVLDSAMLRIGGRDWDKALMDYIINSLSSRSSIDFRNDPDYHERIRRTANEVKHRLSSPTCSMAQARVAGCPSVPVKRAVFDEITEDLLRQTLDLLKEVYDRNNANAPISEIICVGGSSNMPQVSAGIRHMFPDCTVRVFEPELAVVNGAAIYAEMLGPQPVKDSEKSRLNDKSDFSYGIRCFDDYDADPNYRVIVNIIRKDEKLPTVGFRTFYPADDTCTRVSLAIFESEFGDSQFPATEDKKRAVGEMIFQLAAGSSRKTPIRCTMKLNQMGELEVSAVDDKGNAIESVFQLNEL